MPSRSIIHGSDLGETGAKRVSGQDGKCQQTRHSNELQSPHVIQLETNLSLRVLATLWKKKIVFAYNFTKFSDKKRSTRR